jgi:LysM repeat protein/lipoprotein-anchoring transpeptidase ErfK/SrfK
MNLASAPRHHLARLLVLAAVVAVSAARAQSRVEPGLEKAVGWKWRVALPVHGSWVPDLPEPTPVPEATATPEPTAPASFYEVQRGDALVKIARKYGLLPIHLKTYNQLPSDLIRVGQVLKIPSLAEARAIAPLPEPPRPKTPGKKKSADDRGVTPDQFKTAAVQVLLDRMLFSAGPIDGRRSPEFEKVLYLFRLGNPEANDPAKFAELVEREAGDGFAEYVLKESDFRFIAPPKAERAGGDARAAGPSYEDLVRTPQLLYRTPWEFVAERFHCSETFLKNLNPQIKTPPVVGTELRVPNVLPFEIEKLLRAPVQPATAAVPTRAVLLDLAYLQIFQGDRLVAVMPISMARPGLRGRGTWTILDAIVLPRMGTFQEPREQQARPKPLFGQPEPEATPQKPATLATEQFLGPGPNNPAGLVWVNLAKSGSSEPLPYGLHGTSVPDQMQTSYSIGGLQMANWNIVRAARLLPPGTELEWKQGGAPTAPPAAVP